MNKILIVDDEPIVLRNCKRILEDEGYDVATAENGETACQILNKGQFDLVITDLMMPTLNDKELLEYVKENQPMVEIIIITGYATVPSSVEIMKLGAFDYLGKPFTSEELLESVRLGLKRKKAREEIKPDEIYPIDYKEENKKEWENVLAAFREFVGEGRIVYDRERDWTYRKMQIELVKLLRDQIKKRLDKKGWTLDDVTRHRRTLKKIHRLIYEGKLLVLLSRWTELFKSLGIEERYFKGLYLSEEARFGVAKRRIYAFERELGRGRLCEDRAWDLDDIMKIFNMGDQLYVGGCAGRRKCHLEGVVICRYGLEQINAQVSAQECSCYDR